MTKNELISKIQENTTIEITKKDLADVFEATVKSIVDAVADGEKISIQGFGTFESVEKPERVARNPKTGEGIVVPAHKAPKFKFGSGFKAAVKGE